jgi:hypothetical protein
MFFSSSTDVGIDKTNSGERISNLEIQMKGQNDALSTSSMKNNNVEGGKTILSMEPMNDAFNNSSHGQNNNPSFKVSRVSYKTGIMYVQWFLSCFSMQSTSLTLNVPTSSPFFVSETVNLDTATLLKEASVYARDLFFTLNLTSRQERYQQQRSHTSGDSNSKSGAQPTSTYHNNHHGSSGSSNVARRTVSIIQSRKKKIILVSFGTIRAVAGLYDVLLFDAHLPTVRDFAHDLRNTFQSKNNTPPNGHTSSNEECYSSLGNQVHSTSTNEPYELLFLECVLRETVDSYHRRLRLFEPIGTTKAIAPEKCYLSY